VEITIGKLEARQYDTKPIWEQALAAITETNRTMREGFDLLRNELRTEIRSEIAGLRTEMNAEIGRLSNEIGGLRAEMKLGSLVFVRRWNDPYTVSNARSTFLNHNILDLQAEQRYVDSRLQEVESQTKPT